MKSVIRKHFLSVIICTYNSEKTIRDVLECVFKQRDVEKEVILVDDGSTDGTVAICREYPLQILQLDQNRGPAYCRNAGVRLSMGDILFWIDSDIRFEASLFSAVLAKMNEHLEVAGVGTVSSPMPINKGFFPRYYALQECVNMMQMFRKGETALAEMIWTRCGSLKRQVFEEIGGFDESFGKPSLEDYEFSARMRGRYGGILYDKKLMCRHVYPDSFSKIFKRYFANSRLLGQLLLARKVRTVPFISDARTRIAIPLSLLFLILTPFFWPFLFVSGVIYAFALFERRTFLRVLCESEDGFFMLKSWLFYCVFSISTALGFVCGLLHQQLCQFPRESK